MNKPTDASEAGRWLSARREKKVMPFDDPEFARKAALKGWTPERAEKMSQRMKQYWRERHATKKEKAKDVQ